MILGLPYSLLLAPTRKEIDTAHGKRRWLDIGVPSFRNLWNLPRSCQIVWLILAFSSIPIHFMYNAAVFSTVKANGFLWVKVSEAFIRNPELPPIMVPMDGTMVPMPYTFNDTPVVSAADPSAATYDAVLRLYEDVQANLSTYENLTNWECYQNYSNIFTWRPQWVPGQNPQSPTQAEVDTWANKGSLVQYCLRKLDSEGEEAFNTCELQASPTILTVVTCLNFLKCCCIFWVIWYRSEHSLCTLGDAIASFLESPDPHTKSLGLVSKDSIINLDDWQNGGTIEWRPRSIRWLHAASLRRWVFTMTTSGLILGSGFILLGQGIQTQTRMHLSTSPAALWKLGFGTTNQLEIVGWNQPNVGFKGLIANILLANVWQVLISMAYIAHNGLLSTMLLEREWRQYANERKTLRVSHPKGIQRSTYFISMPLRYGIPMMSASALLHWLLSQSVFILRVIVFDTASSTIPTEVRDLNWTMSGFSIYPIIFAVTLGGIVLVLQGLIGLRKLPARDAMPLVASCSAVISANCHRPDVDVNAHLLPVQWGVIWDKSHDEQACSFTTYRDVTKPVRGERYIGVEGIMTGKKTKAQ
ncbi:hypothetical protein EG329_000215 [Mollisiaceae sp. DMI_Dod_QoI]|nr:hypothetical protein EG329_000215 [Helotiales sp. DMI_Dod_QoI]